MEIKNTKMNKIIKQNIDLFYEDYKLDILEIIKLIQKIEAKQSLSVECHSIDFKTILTYFISVKNWTRFWNM